MLHPVAPLLVLLLPRGLIVGVKQRGQFLQIPRRVPEIQNQHYVARENLADEVLQPRAAIGQANPLLGAVHAHLSRLLPQLQPPFVQLVQPRQMHP